jgi:RNA polymerase sigma-70 factor (ECF subfamily)
MITTALIEPAVSDEDAATFEAVRPRLFGVAYRILGRAAEAEEVVQDTWIRWHGADRRAVRNTTAFLTTASARLALNVAESARAQHEAATGWMPEPVDAGGDPTVGAERDEALELAVRTLSERLSPTERAVFVLREAFDYPYRQVADVLGLSEANARQLLVRARARLASGRRPPAAGGDHRRLLAAFRAAAESGDLASLEHLLAAPA